MKKAAFKVGDILININENLKDCTVTTMYKGKETTIYQYGMKVRIIETHPPIKGIGFVRYEEDGEALIDPDYDGYNVIELESGYRKLLFPKEKKNWKKIN